jgi:perosamine synthetase
MKYIKDTISFIQESFRSTEFIPLHAPTFRGKEKDYLIETIDSAFVSSVGAYVNQFEGMMSTITNTKKSVAVVNGTAGIQVALQLVGVSSGDEVITQALTFVATPNAIVYNGAAPIFLDVDIDTMGLSPKAVTQFLEEFGELRAWRIPIVEDAAESLGSEYKSQPTGSIGDMGVFSFNGNKIVTCGGGGAIVTNNEELGIKGKYLTTTAKVPHEYEFYHDELGFNFRMPNINAALACAQLEQLNFFIENKRMLAAEYKIFFNSSVIKFRTETPDTRANYWLMCVELENRKERDLFLAETNAKKVMTRPIWQLMYRLPMYNHCQRDKQLNAQFLEERIVNIPSSVR